MAYEGTENLEGGDEGEAPPAIPADVAPIDKLTPGSELHTKVKEYLQKRIEFSERKMQQFYSRWNVNEKKLQAYIDLPDYERLLKEMNKGGEPPNPVSITVPYTYATIWTIVTYLMHTFCGRKPIFQVGSYKAETASASRYMETMLQYNADHTRLIKHLIQFFFDGSIYGMGVVRNLWEVKYSKRSVWRQQGPLGMLAPNLAVGMQRVREERITYEGNAASSIDPFMFFPDPRVPIQEVNRKGEFVFWRSFLGEFDLLLQEKEGKLKHVKAIGKMPERRAAMMGGSERGRISLGDPHPGTERDNTFEGVDFHQVDQGTIWVIPSKLGLGESDTPERWIFTLVNNRQIVQAEPLDYDHDMHPVAVSEPNTLGYGFGQPAVLDFLGPIQDSLSWFINSHIHNVRSVLNNSIVYDPSMIEEQDLKNPKPGKLIRLKRTAYGQDVRQALQQLQVQDVTAQHVNDMQVFMRMGDSLAAINDNLRGIQSAGDRKTATEVRTSGEAGASRLAATARLISAQAMVDIAEQMAINIQQFQTMEFYLSVVGAKGAESPVPITPQSLAGDFYYPVHDGTLPLDKIALFEIWKEILMAMMQAPPLAQGYDIPRIFERVAELGGVQDLSLFRVQIGEQNEQVPPGAAPVNLPGVRPGGGAPIQGVPGVGAGPPAAPGF